MTSESLREQVERRIAGLNKKIETFGIGVGYDMNAAIVGQGIHELEQVLTLIDEKAKEAETRITLLKNMERVVDGKYYGDLIDGQIVGIEMTLARLAGKRG